MTTSRALRRAAPMLLALALGGCQQLGLGRAAQPATGVPTTVAELRQAVAAQPEDAQLLARLADQAEREGNAAEAASALDRLITLQGPSGRRLVRLGAARLRTGEYPLAAAAFAAARQQAPSDVVAASGHALALDLMGDAAGAREAHARAVQLAPNDLTIRGNHALSLVLAGRAQEAVALLAPVERDRAAPRRARHNLALALAAAGDQPRVVRVLRIDMGAGDAERLASDFRAWAESLPALTHAQAAAALFTAGLPGAR